MPVDGGYHRAKQRERLRPENLLGRHCLRGKARTEQGDSAGGESASPRMSLTAPAFRPSFRHSYCPRRPPAPRITAAYSQPELHRKSPNRERWQVSLFGHPRDNANPGRHRAAGPPVRTSRCIHADCRTKKGSRSSGSPSVYRPEKFVRSTRRVLGVTAGATEKVALFLLVLLVRLATRNVVRRHAGC